MDQLLVVASGEEEIQAQRANQRVGGGSPSSSPSFLLPVVVVNLGQSLLLPSILFFREREREDVRNIFFSLSLRRRSPQDLGAS